MFWQPAPASNNPSPSAFLNKMAQASAGEIRSQVVTGVDGNPQTAYFVLCQAQGQTLAVIDLTIASGLLPQSALAPENPTSYGIGQLIRATLDAGAQRLVVRCGMSAPGDAGAGLAQALGIALRAENGEELALGRHALVNLMGLDLRDRDPRLKQLQLDVYCEMPDKLCGQGGITDQFRDQFGSSSAYLQMAFAIQRFAIIVHSDTGRMLCSVPGGAAGGGIAAGLWAFAKARLLWWEDDLANSLLQPKKTNDAPPTQDWTLMHFAPVL